MCGIFACNSKNELTVATYDVLAESSQAVKARGPDDTRCFYTKHVYLSFHRLIINDLTENGFQPMTSKDETVKLICNGEIFNHVELEKRHTLEMQSGSDCEVIIRLYEKLRDAGASPFQAACCVANALDGEFAGVLYDEKAEMMLAFRDPYGVRPLFIGFDENERMYFASEAKALAQLCPFVEQVVPGHVMAVQAANVVAMARYCIDIDMLSPFSMAMPRAFYTNAIRTLFVDAVRKRMMSERPLCALLSGGLDSSLVAGILAKELGPDRKLNTFSIGLKGSPDLLYACKVAEHIGSIHHSITCSVEDFLGAIPAVIATIESYDITTVRASVGNYLVAKFIAENTDFKVVFNGDYADEVMSGYKYFRLAPSAVSFNDETIRLLSNIHFFDSLRSDRTVSCHGLEARVPYADKNFVEFYLRIPPELRMTTPKTIEKVLIREAFQEDNIIPHDVLFRRKEAFSDGVSDATNSWHKIVQQHIDTMVPDEEFNTNKNVFRHNTPQTKEAYYYRKLFHSSFNMHSNMIPHMWMPQWSDAADPSAREL